MGGGGGNPPAPKTFTPPPLDSSPATNPIPNYFGAHSGNPFQALGNIPAAQAQNPFQQQGMLTPDIIEALLRRIRGQG